MSNIRYSAAALWAMTALFLTALPASAQTAAFSFTSSAFGVTDNATDTGAASYNLGYEFTVGAAPVTVTSLGYFNEPSFDPNTPFNTVNLNPEPGGTYTYSTDHQVGLYDTSGNLLASADVTSASTPSGDFLYTPLGSSLTLGPGNYIIAGVTGPTDPYMFNVEDDSQPGFVGLVSSFPITWDEDVATTGSDLTAFPGLSTTDGQGPGYFGPNFLYSVVPESSSLALILPALLALLAFVAFRRLIRKPLVLNNISNNLSKSIVCLIATIAILLAVALSSGPAQATVPAGPSVNLAQLVAQVNALQTTVNNQQATIDNLQNTVNAQAAQISALQAKTAPISIQNGVGTNTEMFLTGVNLHIVNGLGATDGNPADPLDNLNDPITDGLGNLIIGYNETRGNSGTDVRTGSHNLVLGDTNNYSSFGGIIGGTSNSISGAYASIITGSGNQANSFFASILGGAANTSSGVGSVVIGGLSNTASNEASAVLGGVSNTASGVGSVVTGGLSNTASGTGTIAP